jgi:hypothetical protein
VGHAAHRTAEGNDPTAIDVGGVVRKEPTTDVSLKKLLEQEVGYKSEAAAKFLALVEKDKRKQRRRLMELLTEPPKPFLLEGLLGREAPAPPTPAEKLEQTLATRTPEDQERLRRVFHLDERVSSEDHG